MTTDTYIKRCLTSLAIREIKIETKMRNHFTPTGDNSSSILCVIETRLKNKMTFVQHLGSKVEKEERDREGRGTLSSVSKTCQSL